MVGGPYATGSPHTQRSLSVEKLDLISYFYEKVKGHKAERGEVWGKVAGGLEVCSKYTA